MKAPFFAALAALSFLLFAAIVAIHFTHENEWYIGRHQLYREKGTLGWISYDTASRERLGYPSPTFRALNKKPFGVMYDTYRDVRHNVFGISIAHIDDPIPPGTAPSTRPRRP